MSVSLNSNTTGNPSGAGTVYLSGVAECTTSFSGIRVARSSVFYIVLCRSLCVSLILANALTVLRFTAFNYLFCIFKISLEKTKVAIKKENQETRSILDSRHRTKINNKNKTQKTKKRWETRRPPRHEDRQAKTHFKTPAVLIIVKNILKILMG
jgi:hypothetical protein